MSRHDPEKEKHDLWIVAPESMVPFSSFASLVQKTRELLPQDARKCRGKSALVAADAFRMAQLNMYRNEARSLPFQLRVFLSKQEAMDWLNGSDGDDHGEEGC